MKFATEYLWFNTEHHREYINITDEVEEIVVKSGIREGMVLVSAMHITAGIYVNDAENGLIADIDKWLEERRRKAVAVLGSMITPAKVKASRLNGRKSGRPRKDATVPV